MACSNSSAEGSRSSGAGGSGAAQRVAAGAASPLSALSLLRLDAHQLACICATAAEAAVLLPGAELARCVPWLLNASQLAVAARSHTGAVAAVAGSTPAAVEPVPDVLTLLVQLVMPAALHLAAQAVDPAAASREAWVGISFLLQDTLARGNVFGDAAFQQHPAAVLAAFEAVARALSADGASSPARQQQYVFGLMRELEQGLSHNSLRLPACLATAASEPGPARALLYLFTSCVKALAADWSGQAAGDPDAAAQSEGGAMAAVCTALLVAVAAQEAQRSIVKGGEDSGSSSRSRSRSRSADLQQLLDGFAHVTGKALYTAGALLSAALPDQTADSSAEEGMAAAAALPWGNSQTPNIPRPSPILQRLQQFELLVPGGCAGSRVQQQLLERCSSVTAAAAAVRSLCFRLAQQAPEAEAAAVAETATAEVRAALGDAEADAARSWSSTHLLLVNNAQVQLLLATHAEGRRLADALTGFGSALCAALPTKFACNDPACGSCDQLSEQRLVGGKGSVCSGCRVARFCCMEHHHRSWKAHKAACKALAAAAAAGSGGGAGSSGASSSAGKAKPKRAQA